MPLLGAALLEHGAARHHDIAAAAIHLQNLKRLRDVHQRRDIANRTNVDLAARQERHRAVEVDGEAALDRVEDDAVDFLALLERLLELDPAFLSPRFVARDDGFAERVFDPLEIDLDLVADFRGRIAAVVGEFLQRDPAFGLQTDVDQRHVFFDRDDATLDDGAFEGFVFAVSLVQ